MSGFVVDSSVWIDFLAGQPVPLLEEALRQGIAVLPPIVAAELVSGARRPAERRAIEGLVEELPLHECPREHWIRVGEMRRMLLGRGITISTPDAHVAQCALDRDAVLLARDGIFPRISLPTGLRVDRG